MTPRDDTGPARGESVSAAPLMQLATAYWGSQTLFAANRLGVFERLAEGPRTARDLAVEIGADPHRMDLLLKSCVGLGLLASNERGFANTAASDAFLVPGGAAYLGNAITYGEQMTAPWAELERSVREGVPTLPHTDYLGGNPDQTRHFVRGMHERAIGVGRALTEMVDLTGRRRMLDVGGGPGTYSALFTQNVPDLRSVVLELPGIAAIAAEILEELGVQDRVELMEGSFHSTPFPAGNDVVLCSGIFHRETAETCRDLVGRAVESLEPGGLLIVSDVFSDPGGTSPPFAPLFGLNMALSAPDGGVHSDSDVADWMRAEGLEEIACTPFPPPMPHRTVIGRKP